MAGLSVKGSASVSVNEQGLEATLQFVPDPELRGLDFDIVLKLIGTKQLSPPPSPKLIEEFLQKASKAKAPFEMVVSQALLPEQPQAESVDWEELPFPDDIAPFAEETLSKAKPPELYRIKVEKVKRESLVRKASLLPFLPPKEDIVVSWDKKETSELVQVNPALKAKGYAEKGTRLGIFHPQKPGKPGKNVFGRLIQPGILAESAFFIGTGLSREKNEVKASISGIIRIGENWADIIPLAKPAWEVTKGSDGVTLFLYFEPGDPRFSVPQGKEILAEARELGAPEENLIPMELVEREIHQAQKDRISLEAFPLFKTREAEARVIFSPRNVKAFLYLRKGLAGARPLEMKTISAAIKESGVQGFNAEKLRADISAFMKGPDIELKDYLLAEGTEASRGSDKEVIFSIGFFKDDERIALIEKLNRIPQWHFSADDELLFPPAETTDAALVDGNAKLATVRSSKQGQDGRDVFGNVLPAQPGNDPELKLAGALRLHGLEIRAEKSGLLLVKREGRSVQMEILDYRDASVLVHVPEDGMEARIEIFKERGAGKPLAFEMVTAKLAEAGIVRGIDVGALEEAYTIALGKGFCPPHLIAKGEVPVSAGGSSLKWLIPHKKGNAEGQHQFPPITAGTALAEIQVQGNDGRAGFDVKGTVLSPEQGTSVVIEHDDSITEEADGSITRLFAAASGELLLRGKKLSVVSRKLIKGDVGPETGSINFAGEIRIAGNVQPGFQVIGSQDLFIAGGARAALLSAGGKAVVSRGILGAGKGVIRARKTIDAGSVEQATLLALEDIRIQDSCTGSSVKTNGKLYLTGDGSSLAGGTCKARRGVDAVNIGSEQGKTTEISFGQDYLIKDQIEVTEGEIAKAKALLIQIEKKISLARNREDELAKARAEKVVLMKMIEQLGLRLFNLREKFEEHHESEIRVRGIIFPGVVMESHDRYYEVKQKRNRVVFYFDRETGRIKERPLEDPEK